MKPQLLKLLTFLILLVTISSCQRTQCPAYSKIDFKPKYKPTFLTENGRR